MVQVEERQDLEANGIFLKYVKEPCEKHEWEAPSDNDFIKVDFRIRQGEQELVAFEALETTLEDPRITLTMRKCLESMKRNEQARIDIKSDFIPAEDRELIAQFNDKYVPAQAVEADIHLHKLIKSEDWFKDGSTIVKTLRKGKGRNPFVDSTVKIRLGITVNGQQLISNYPKNQPDMLASTLEEGEESKEGKPYNYEDSENLRDLTADQRKAYLTAAEASLWSLRIDSYSLPSLMIKILKTMKKNGVVEVRTTRVAKMQSNFANEMIGLDQHKDFKEGDEIIFQISLLDCSYPRYFYKLLVVQKLEHIQYLKGMATKFFKAGNYKKAADLYQKINGYYNFGDSTNNYAKEDAESEEFKKDNGVLQSLKLTCFNNLVVCKHKLEEWQSVIGITD